MKFKSVKRRKVHEDVAEQIEDQILSGGLEEGAHLPAEREMMEAFNVGRSAVREALLLLQLSGFVQMSSTGRPVVARPTTTNFVEQLSSSARFLLSSEEGERSFQDARRLFEAAIARNAAEIATPRDIERLESALVANRGAVGDIGAFERTDVEFHLAISNIGGNPVFPALHMGIAEWLTNQRTVSLRVPGVEATALESHEKIFDAIAQQAPEQAWHEMDQHLRDIMKQFEKGSQHGVVLPIRGHR